MNSGRRLGERSAGPLAPAPATGEQRGTGRLAFTGPMRVAIVVMVIVALAVLAIIIGPREFVPIGATSPSPSARPASASAIATATTTPASTPSAAPPTATPMPAPLPAWTGLAWVHGTIAGNEDRSTGLATIHDVVRWNGRYVGAGAVDFFADDPMFPAQSRAAAFFTSDDGVSWTITEQFPAVQMNAECSYEVAAPYHVVAVGDGLLAVSSDCATGARPQAWHSSDGLSWAPLNGAFVDLWTAPTLVGLAASPAGAVAIGFDGGGCCLAPAGPPLIAYSAEGASWERLDAPTVPDRALLQDVATTPDGFVIVGSVRHPDEPIPPGDDTTGDADAYTPAAWASVDGVHWTAATVEGSEARDAQITALAVGVDGLYATGQRMDVPIITMEPDRAWVSTDGRRWAKAGTPGVDLPAVRLLVSDGTRMVTFGPLNPTTTDLAAWVSTDGLPWTPLAFSGATQNLPPATTHLIRPDGTEDWIVGTSTISHAWVEADGVIIGQVLPAPGGGQAVWYGSAVVP